MMTPTQSRGLNAIDLLPAPIGASSRRRKTLDPKIGTTSLHSNRVIQLVLPNYNYEYRNYWYYYYDYYHTTICLVLYNSSSNRRKQMLGKLLLATKIDLSAET